MKILGIDISTTLGSVGLVDERQILGEDKFRVIGGGKGTLLGRIDRLLEATGVPIEQLEGVAVAIGPGSFTGLRVGLATAKGLCVPRNLPLAGVSTLEALASLLPYCRLPVLATLDARRGEIYAALYNTESGAPLRVGEEVSLPPEELHQRFDSEVVIIGDALEAYGDRLKELYGGKAHLLPGHDASPGGALIALLGRERILRGELLSIDDSVPTYIRPAERIFKKRS
jgi:tRNA threonylcarbamoyladenosine biosynthesis protein TsaB